MSRVVFFELSATNYNTPITFFNRVFNWEFSVVEEDVYWLIRTGNDDLPGINGGLQKEGNNKLINVIEVKSIEQTIKKIKKNSGEVLGTKMRNGFGKMVYFKTPNDLEMAAIEFNKYR